MVSRNFGLGKPLDAVWRPHMLAAIGYTGTRGGDVAAGRDRFISALGDRRGRARGLAALLQGRWGYGTGLLDHQVALLARGCARVSIAVLTMHDGSQAYGKDTLRGIFTRLLRGFPTGSRRTRQDEDRNSYIHI